MVEYGAAAKERAKGLLRHIRAAQGDQGGGGRETVSFDGGGGGRQVLQGTPVPFFRSLEGRQGFDD